ncbi:MAG: hypothetical protein KC466_00475, partial [Myxococcales bacterium]|nr:hypothetical protein [Myxococcales bacterium]
ISTIEDVDLFQNGDAFPIGAAHAPIGPANQIFDSNYYSGDPSNFSLTNVDTVSFAPDIRADVSYDGTLPPGGGGCSAMARGPGKAWGAGLLPYLLAFTVVARRIRRS